MKLEQLDKQVTIYYKNGFGSITKLEGKLKDFGYREFAQYKKAPFVKFVQKRKRKVTNILQGYNPFLLVLEGHNHLDPDAMSLPVNSDIFANVTVSKYSSFDKRYCTEFDDKFNYYIKDKIVLLDKRYTQN